MEKIINQPAYDEIMDGLRSCLKFYDGRVLHDTKYTFGLSNGNYLNIRIYQNQIAHLLGVDVDFLRNSGLFKANSSSYEILLDLINKYSYSTFASKLGKENVGNIFSKNIEEKIDAFRNNVSIKSNDIYCIVKYDSEKTYQFEEDFEKADYYLIRYIDKKYHVLSLIKSDRNNDYYAQSSRLYNDEAEFNEFLSRIAKKQEVVYPYMLKVQNHTNEYDHTFLVNMNDKKEMLEKIIKISDEHGAVPSVANDFQNSLSKTINSYQKTDNNYDIIRVLTSSVKNNNVLSDVEIENIIGDTELNDAIRELIDVVNDKTCSNVSDDDSQVSVSYSCIQNENSNLKSELEQMKQLLEEYKASNERLKEENKKLVDENNITLEKEKIFEEALSKVKSLNK